MIKTIKNSMISILLKMLFYQGPNLDFSDDESGEYEKLFEDARHGDGVIRYASPYPKHRFIQYISKYKDVLVHGTNHGEITTFEPRKQTLYNGQQVEAVFASKDGIWPVFFAILDREKMYGSIRNGCFELNKINKYYFFSINQETHAHDPWTNGTIYFLPKTSFNKVGGGIVTFDEWISETSVVPLAKIDVEKEDFYFHHKVSVHKSVESLYKTWLLYKLRKKA